MVDLDVALRLLAECSLLFNRMNEKGKVRLLKIQAKRIIIDKEGEIIDQELNSPFTYLRSLSLDVSTPSWSIVQSSEQANFKQPEFLHNGSGDSFLPTFFNKPSQSQGTSHG